MMVLWARDQIIAASIFTKDTDGSDFHVGVYLEGHFTGSNIQKKYLSLETLHSLTKQHRINFIAEHCSIGVNPEGLGSQTPRFWVGCRGGLHEILLYPIM